MIKNCKRKITKKIVAVGETSKNFDLKYKKLNKKTKAFIKIITKTLLFRRILKLQLIVDLSCVEMR